MSQVLLTSRAPTLSRRLIAAVILLVLCLLAKRLTNNFHSHTWSRHETASQDVPIAADIEFDPAKSFPSALGLALTAGFDIQGHPVKVLTWHDVDRKNYQLLGAVLAIPKALFDAFPDIAGCTYKRYRESQCRFNLEFVTGTPQIAGFNPLQVHANETTSRTADQPSRL